MLPVFREIFHDIKRACLIGFLKTGVSIVDMDDQKFRPVLVQPGDRFFAQVINCFKSDSLIPTLLPSMRHERFNLRCAMYGQSNSWVLLDGDRH